VTRATAGVAAVPPPAPSDTSACGFRRDVGVGCMCDIDKPRRCTAPFPISISVTSAPHSTACNQHMQNMPVTNPEPEPIALWPCARRRRA
jgi:hypothetical protein